MKQGSALFNHLPLQQNNGVIDTFIIALIIVDPSQLINRYA
jgi:hypothetical protein